MKFIKQSLNDTWIIEPKVFNDNRGYFTETYRKELFDQYIGKIEFVQDNESKSVRGVFRGLHYQKGGFSQAKLVRVLQGVVLDIIVDLRASSSTFGHSLMVELSEDNKRQLFVPRGFAHGFLVVSETAVFSYKVDNIYSPEHEVTLAYHDKVLGIQLPDSVADIHLSDKDKNGFSFAETPKFP